MSAPRTPDEQGARQHFREVAHRRSRRIALGFGLPWAWMVRERSGRLIAEGPALPCGHRSIGTVIPSGDLLVAASRLAYMVTRHMRDGI